MGNPIDNWIDPVSFPQLSVVSMPAANKNHAEVLTGKEILGFCRNPENCKNVFRAFLDRLSVPLGLGA